MSKTSLQSGGQPKATFRLAIQLSEAVLIVEKAVVSLLMALLLLFIILNVVTRYAGIPLYWVDEAVVFAMVWLAFIGASALTRLRLDFSVTPSRTGFPM